MYADIRDVKDKELFIFETSFSYTKCIGMRDETADDMYPFRVIGVGDAYRKDARFDVTILKKR